MLKNNITQKVVVKLLNSFKLKFIVTKIFVNNTLIMNRGLYIRLANQF